MRIVFPDRTTAVMFLNLKSEEKDAWLRERIAEHDVDLFGRQYLLLAQQIARVPAIDVFGGDADAVRAWRRADPDEGRRILAARGATAVEIELFLERWIEEAGRLPR